LQDARRTTAAKIKRREIVFFIIACIWCKEMTTAHPSDCWMQLFIEWYYDADKAGFSWDET
jgi:hypothetical protein